MPKRFKTPDPQIIMYEDGTFYVRVGDRERSLRTKDFTIAQKRKTAVLGILDKTGEASARLRFGDIWDEYIRFRKTQVELKTKLEPIANSAQRGRKTISIGTFREMKNLWRLHLGPFWSQVRVDKADEQKWVEYTEQSTVIDLANHRKVYRGLLKWCKFKRYIKYIPEMSIPPVDRRERRVLKPNEIKKLFRHAQGSVLVFISMYLFMGMRRKEIMTLRWSRIHFDEEYLVLAKSEVKTRKGRPLPMNAFVMELLRDRQLRQKARKIKTDFVFPNLKSPLRHADLSGLKTAWNRIIGLCGFELGYVTPHDLRATFEAYAHKATAFTDTQREKFAGAAIDLQKKTYVRFDANDVRGLESVVKVDGLEEILIGKIKNTGKSRGESFEESMH